RGGADAPASGVAPNPAAEQDCRSARRRGRQGARRGDEENDLARGPLAIEECLTALVRRYSTPMTTLLWIIAVIIGIAGVVALLRRQILWGVILIVVALLVGPGGVSIFT